MNVCACESVPDDVKVQMWELCNDLQVKLSKKIEDDDTEMLKGKMPVEEGDKVTPTNFFKKRGVSNQATINNIFKKNLRKEACLEIASFFYNNVIAFNVAKSDEFQRMLEMVARHGLGFKSPSYHELKTKYLNQKM
jgi:hypothetical protein